MPCMQLSNTVMFVYVCILCWLTFLLNQMVRKKLIENPILSQSTFIINIHVSWFHFRVKYEKRGKWIFVQNEKHIWIIIKLELLKKAKLPIFLLSNSVKICNIITDAILSIFRKPPVSCLNLNLISNEHMTYFIYQ